MKRAASMTARTAMVAILMLGLRGEYTATYTLIRAVSAMNASKDTACTQCLGERKKEGERKREREMERRRERERKRKGEKGKRERERERGKQRGRGGREGRRESEGKEKAT